MGDYRRTMALIYVIFSISHDSCFLFFKIRDNKTRNKKQKREFCLQRMKAKIYHLKIYSYCKSSGKRSAPIWSRTFADSLE